MVVETRCKEATKRNSEQKFVSPKRLFRFGLRGLLILVTLCAGALGYWNYKYASLKNVATLLNSDEQSFEFYEPGDLELAPLSSLDKFAYKIYGIETDPRTVMMLEFWEAESLGGIECFENLEELWVSEGGFSDLSPLQNLKKLETLHLEGENLSDLGPLNGLPALKNLEIESDALKSLPGLDGCKKLESIELTAENLESVDRLGEIESLQNLGLSDSNVKDISAVAHLKNLIYLDIGGCAVSDISALSSLTKLESIYLGETLVTDIAPVSHMPNLEVLVLSDTKVADISPLRKVFIEGKVQDRVVAYKALPPIKNTLYRLDLENTPVESLEPLTGFENLRQLNMKGSKIRSLRGIESSKGLRHLVLNNTPIEDLSTLEGFASLRSLDLTNTKLESLESLPELKLEKIEIGGSSFKSLAGLGNGEKLDRDLDLREVRISNCQIAELAELGSIEGLHTVFLDSIPAKSLPEFKSRHLSRFELDGVAISDFSTLYHKPLRILRINSPGSSFSAERLFSYLSRPEELDKLEIEDADVGDLKVLKPLAGLTDLSLVNCDMSGFDALANLTGIRNLTIADCELTEIDWITEFKDLDAVKFLRCTLSDISALAVSPGLFELDLTGCPVKDISPLALSNKNRLKILNLNQTDVVDLGVLSDFQGLEDLRICDTGVTDLGPLIKSAMSRKAVGNSPSFRTKSEFRCLQMAGVMLDVPSSLADLDTLNVLDVSGTNITKVEYVPRGLTYLAIADLEIDEAKLKRHQSKDCEITKDRPSDQRWSRLRPGSNFF